MRPCCHNAIDVEFERDFVAYRSTQLATQKEPKLRHVFYCVYPSDRNQGGYNACCNNEGRAQGFLQWHIVSDHGGPNTNAENCE